jgi:hypothetical protein
MPQGAPVLTGMDNDGTDTTSIRVTQPSGPALRCSPEVNWGIGIEAYHGFQGGVAVQGLGHDGVGVRGISDTASGLEGYSPTGIGVLGATATGAGVLGFGSDPGSVGVYGAANERTAYALRTDGRVDLDRSGVRIVPAGSQSLTVPNAYLEPDSLVLATLQDFVPRVLLAGVVLDIPNERFTIMLSRATPVDLPVGWFIIR